MPVGYFNQARSRCIILLFELDVTIILVSAIKGSWVKTSDNAGGLGRDSFDRFWQNDLVLRFYWILLVDLDSIIIVFSPKKSGHTPVCLTCLSSLLHSRLEIISNSSYVEGILSYISKIFWTSADIGFILALQSLAWNLEDNHIVVGVSPLGILTLIN